MKRLVLAWCRLAILAMCMWPLGLLQATTTWNGAVVAGVTDDNIDITGNVQLGVPGGRIAITANTVDVVVGSSVAGGNFEIAANDLAGQPVALDLVISAGRTITFDLTDFDLTCRGNNAELLITHSGPGQIVLNVGNGHQFRLSHAVGGIYGAFFLTSMRTDRTVPAVLIKRAATGNLDAVVYVDNYSYFGFVGTDTTLATQAATIQFDPTNALANTGRLKMVVAEQTTALNFASFAIEGVYNTATAVFPYNLADVDFDTLAGQQANVIINTDKSGWAGLLVVSNNEAYPMLRANPWLEALPHNVGLQPGFLMGKNGHMQLNDGTYFDYVSATANMLEVKEGAVPVVPVIPLLVLQNFEVNGNLPQLNTLIKQRNPSAFIVDAGDPTSEQYATIYPSVDMLGTSKMYFRSSVDSETVQPSMMRGPSPLTDFTVDPTKQFTGMAGYGSIVFDVEGRLDITGVSTGATKTNGIEILSLLSADVGGSVMIKGTETNFKLRTFEADTNGVLKQYGKACFLINGRLNVRNMAFQHTDMIHRIYEKNTPQESEPCYIGGETFFLKQLTNYRPTIAFYNADLQLNTSAALTGVDLLTPSNGSGESVAANSSKVYFYYNGWKIDTIGRSLILGTNIGSTAEDLGSVISRAAHYNAWQEFSHAAAVIESVLKTDSNNIKVTPGLNYTIDGQLATHTVYLAHDTNMSLGVDAATGTDPITQDTFALTSPGRLLVDAEYINFESQGGDPLNKPETSIETGQGGIFIDNFGYFGVNGTLRLFISAMVGVGPYGTNSVVVLPENQVYFDNRVGIANSRLDLSDSSQRDIVPASSIVSDFSLDWEFVTKDYTNWTPYLVPNVVAAGLLPAPIAANIASLPVVHGTVGQFQIFNSRQGDPANLIVDGGQIRDLEFLLGTKSGENPTGILIVTNDAKVGIGKFNTVAENKLVLGIDGLTIMPNGSGQIYLNDDIVVDNICHIIAGPDFGTTSSQQLTITSQVPREFRIKAGATLDLSMFDRPNREVVFAGQVRVIFEPGSRLILGKDAVTGTGGIMTFTDFASMAFERHIQQNRPVGTSVTSTDDIRVRISGRGTIRMLEDSFVEIPREAYAGIESAGITGINATAISWIFQDSARMEIGTDTDFGGSLQVGNTASIDGGSVATTFQLNGIGVIFEVNGQGFLGLGNGIVNKTNSAPNNWRVGNLYNVTSVALAIDHGTFKYNEIYIGSNENASLIALGAMSTGFTISSTTAYRDTQILGGGNLVLVSGTDAYINPTVLTTDGTISTSLSAGIFSSKSVLLDSSKTAPAFPATPANAFTYLKANSYQSQIIKRAELCRLSLDSVTAGYVSTSGSPAVSTINRPVIQGVLNIDGSYTDPARCLATGVTGVALDANLIPTFYGIRV